MIITPDPRLEPSAIRKRYNNPNWYSDDDEWHRFTANSIEHQLHKIRKIFPHNLEGPIINVGAGGNNYDLHIDNMINMDISEALISGMHIPLQASAESLPIKSSCVKGIICVGSVINYCDAAVVLAEFSRVLSPKGFLILEFESSYSAELIRQSAFRQSAAIAETFYASRSEAVWVYSPAYIKNLLKHARLTLIDSVPIHILSPWALLFFGNLKIAATIARLDDWARPFSHLNRWSSNHVFFCEKQI